MGKQPYCNIGALTFRSRQNAGLIGKGTGTLISPNLVLTTACCIYSSHTGEVHFDFKFYPGQHGELEEPYEIEDISFPEKYFLQPGLEYSYALLKLKKKVARDSFIPLSACFKEITKDSMLSLFGYPDKDNYQPTNLEGTKFRASQFGSTSQGRVELID